jgi:hypothetical protein
LEDTEEVEELARGCPGHSILRDMTPGKLERMVKAPAILLEL